MRLKSLVIQGFKSFADKSALDFEPGLTGIVGPNGCGKSNVVDAIRWVMGEQSPRSLRGAEMSDILFGGTQRRTPGGFAKVEMLLVPEPGDAEVSEAGGWAALVSPGQEIEITRKLSRAGESQYFLNRTRCRLRDITELLMEARLASKEYSIIEQGRIDRILSLKPQDRVQIFEEAAGVRRFYLQRDKANQKLTQTLENLDRVADIHSEVEKQCDRLERQATAARKFLEMAQELERVKTSLFLKRKERIEAATSASQAEWTELERVETGFALALVELQSELVSAEERLRLEQKSRSRIEAELRSIETSLKASEAERGALASTEPQLTEQIRAAEAGTELLDRRAEELVQDLLAASEEEVLLAAQLDGSNQDLSTAQSELGRRKQEVTALEDSAQRARQEFVALHARHAAASGERRRLAETLEKEDRLQVRLSKSLAELDDEQRKLAETRSGLDRKSAALAEEWMNLEEEFYRLEEQQNLAGARARRAQQLLHEVEKKTEGIASRSRTLEELVKSMEGFGDGARSVLQWAKARGEKPSLLLQSLDIAPEIEPAVTAALGDRLEAVVAPSLRWALEAIDALGQELSPTGFIVRDLLADAPSKDALPHDALLQQVRWLPGSDPKLASALASFRYVAGRGDALDRLQTAPSGQVLVTGQGETFDPDGLVVAGMQKSRAGLSLKRVQEARRLKDQLRVLESQRQSLAQEVRSAEDELAMAATVLGELQPRKRVLEGDRSRIGVELEKLDFQLQRAFLDRSGLEQQVGQLNNQLASGRAQMEELASLTFSLEKAIAQAEESERLGGTQLSDARTRLRAFEEDELVARRLESRSLAERLKAVTTRATDLQKRKSETQEERKRRATEAKDALRRLEEVRQRLERLDLNQKSFAERRAQVAETLTEETARCQATSETVTDRRNRMQGIHVQRQAVLEAQGQLRVRLAEHRFAAESLNEFRASLPEILPEDLQSVAHLQTEADLEGRSAELERKQKALGSLNFAAVEEHETCVQRLQFLTTQKTDLETSVADLRTAIAQLSERASTLFQEAFAAVRVNFQQLFSQVLAEGSADLLLVESQEGPGVEIRAQPPGKKLRSLELLSGGEKALVTILLLVAIFQYRPSTFCILDEVDAPLDDVNNRRFSDLLGTIAKTSQVLVVTHSKRTIEACDSLYGVTMDEPGVSKLVSVRLQGRKAS